MRTEDLTGKIVGKLEVLNKVPKEEYQQNYKGTLWYCRCKCGNIIQVRHCYLTGNGNYTQTSCGCNRKIRAFLSSCKMNIDENYLNNFEDDFEKFLFLHKALTLTSGKTPTSYNIEEYKEDISYFWNNKQFNTIYKNWLNSKNNSNAYYDWYKPSLDHKVPKSRGGSNKRDNLQFLTVLENLSKRDLTWEEWEEFKKKTNTTSDLFLENILGKGGQDIGY